QQRGARDEPSDCVGSVGCGHRDSDPGPSSTSRPTSRSGRSPRMSALHRVAALALAGAAAPVLAGPPYLTDDPVPTDTGHWEIYAFTAGEGRGSTLDDETGVDLNYGPVKGVQLTATLPSAIAHDRETGWRVGTGDVEIGVKYRFFHDEQRGLSAAIFPRVILRTSSLGTNEKTRVLLPLWIGKDFAGG